MFIDAIRGWKRDSIHPRTLAMFGKIQELFRAISREIDSQPVVIEMRNNSDRRMLCAISSSNSSLQSKRFPEQTGSKLIATRLEDRQEYRGLNQTVSTECSA